MVDSRILRIGFLGTLTILVLGLGLSVVAAPLWAERAEEEELPQTLSAVAANMGTRGPRGQVRLDIRIDRWSSDEERAVLVEAMKESGPRSLSDALRQQERVGRLRELQGLGHDLRYSRVIPTEDGGRQIILASDRPIAFGEAARSTRSLDNNVSLIQMTLDAEGSGEGQLMLGAEFSWDEENNRLTIESFSSEPVRLTGIRLR